jgi:hypothetical protein
MHFFHIVEPPGDLALCATPPTFLLVHYVAPQQHHLSLLIIHQKGARKLKLHLGYPAILVLPTGNPLVLKVPRIRRPKPMIGLLHYRYFNDGFNHSNGFSEASLHPNRPPSVGAQPHWSSERARISVPLCGLTQPDRVPRIYLDGQCRRPLAPQRRPTSGRRECTRLKIVLRNWRYNQGILRRAHAGKDSS